MKNLKRLMWIMYLSLAFLIMAYGFMLHQDHLAMMQDHDKIIMREMREATP